MVGYLLDNNIISVLARPVNPKYSVVNSHRIQIGDRPAMLPVIAVAEIEYGLAKATEPDLEQQQQLREYLADYIVLPFDKHTVEPYSLIRAELWRRYATKKGRKHKEKLPEDLKDRETGKELGIDERDLMIASIAIQYNLVFATADRNSGMLCIEEAARALASQGHHTNLVIDDWSIPLS